MAGIEKLLRTGGALEGALAGEAVAAWGAARTPARNERIGPYRVLGEIGRGGMAIVYEAERVDGEFEQRVALKWMRDRGDDVAERFRHERQVLARLRHAHIAHLLDGGRTADGMAWFAMELIEGLPIDRWCTEHALARSRILDLFDQVAAAVAFAHGHLLVHRDIKPSNVLVDSDGSAKLLDFGIATVAGSDGSHRYAFTPNWASPEQQRGEPVGIASDVYQLGLLLRCLLEGRVATLASDLSSRRTGEAAAEATPLHASPPQPLADRTLSAILAKACAAATADRYTSVDALRADLRAWRSRRPVAAVAGGGGYRVGLFLRRNAWASGITLVAVLLLLALGTWAALRIAAERDRALEQARRSNAVREFIVSMLHASEPGTGHGGTLSVREVLDQGTERIDHELAGEPELQATMLITIADVHLALGDLARFEHLNARALVLYDRMPDIPRARVAARWLEQARATGKRGDAAAGLDLLDRAAAMLGETAADPALRVRIEVSRSAMLARQGRLDEADATTERAYADAVRLLGRNDPTTVYARTNVAWLLLQRGESEAALAAFREAIATLERLAGYGPTHAETLLLRVALAEALLATGQAAAARAEADALAPDLARVRGPARLGLGRALATEARAALEAHDVPAAREALRRAAGTEGLEQLGLAARIDLELATALVDLADGDAAAAATRLARLDAANVGYRNERVEVRLALARARCVAGDTQGADAAFARAAEIAASLDARNAQRRRAEAVAGRCSAFASSAAPWP